MSSSVYLNISEINNSQWNWNSSSNSSEVFTGISSPKHKLIVDSIVLCTAVLSLLSMGCEVDKKQIFHHLRRPIGILIGMFSQFVLLPFAAFLLSRVISLSKFHAAGVLIISCSPGGGISNLFTYFCDGDISLSVTMTTLSAILAMGMMPLNVWIYGRTYEAEDLVIPYNRLASSLAIVTSPVALGAIFQWKIPRIAFFVAKIGIWVSLLLIIILSILQVLWFPDMFLDAPPHLFVFICSLHLIGVTVGYVAGWLLQQTMKVRKAIAIECGVQNIPTALAVIALSFLQQEQRHILALPWLYGFMTLFSMVLLCIAYQAYKKCKLYKGRKLELPGKENNGLEVSAL